jgi:hypothetical protein
MWKRSWTPEEYSMITNDVSDYINLLVRIAHIICNHPIYGKVNYM